MDWRGSFPQSIPKRTGKVMFEMAGVEENLAREAFNLAAAKLPIKTRFIRKDI